MEQIEYTQPGEEASLPVQSRQQEEAASKAMPGLYVRPELRREGDIRDVTLGPSPGEGEAGNPTLFKEGSGLVAPGSGEGEGFTNEPEEQSQKKKDSGSGEGAAFRNP